MRATEEEEAQSCHKEANFDHWFLRFRCAAGLHNLILVADDEDGEDEGEGNGGLSFVGCRVSEEGVWNSMAKKWRWKLETGKGRKRNGGGAKLK